MFVTGLLVSLPGSSQSFKPKNPGSSQSFKPKNIESTGLTAEQAKQVLLVVLKHEGFKMSDRGMWIDGPWRGEEKGTLYRPGYYDFGVVYSNRKAAASNVLGHFAVNALTGDVWNTVRCKRYGFPGLTEIQTAISSQTGKALVSEDVAFDEVGCF
jgi:hypothetical protein